LFYDKLVDGFSYSAHFEFSILWAKTPHIKSLWAIVILLLFPALILFSTAFVGLFRASLPESVMLKSNLASPLSLFPLVFLSFMSGPFSEELGWRGFVLDPLLEMFGILKASVYLGLVWGIWFLPLYFMPQTWNGKMGFQLTGFWSFLLLFVVCT
jgi:uncharacterized protein